MLGWRVAIVGPRRIGVEFMCRPVEVGAEFPIIAPIRCFVKKGTLKLQLKA